MSRDDLIEGRDPSEISAHRSSCVNASSECRTSSSSSSTYYNEQDSFKYTVSGFYGQFASVGVKFYLELFSLQQSPSQRRSLQTLQSRVDRSLGVSEDEGV